MGLLEFLQYVRGEEPSGYTWYVHFPFHGNPVTEGEMFEQAREALRADTITMSPTRGNPPPNGMLMQVTVSENDPQEVRKAAEAVVERRLQSAKLSLERVLQIDNDRRADNLVARLEKEEEERKKKEKEKS